MSSGSALLLGLLLLAGNAFFVGAEFAVLSARRSSIEPLAEAGNRRARTVLWAMEHVSLMLACAQLGVTVCSTGLGVVAEPALAHLIIAPLTFLGISTAFAHPIAFVLALGIVVFLHVVLGEMVPKNLAVSRPDKAVMWFGPPLVWIGRLVKPLIVSLNWLANHVVALSGVEPKSEVSSAFTAAEVRSIVARSQAEGMLADEVGLLSGSIQFSERTAGDVMVPLTGLIGVRKGCTPDDVEALVTKTGYSRFPVLGEGEQVSGYLHLKDVLYASESEREVPVPSWRVRALASARLTDEVEDVLAAMQRSGSHLAIIQDDDGAQLGIVFLEDILEELVGEVRDAMQRGTI